MIGEIVGRVKQALSDDNSLARNGSESACEASQRASLVGASVGEAVTSTCKEIFRASFADERAYKAISSNYKGVLQNCEGVLLNYEAVASNCKGVLLNYEAVTPNYKAVLPNCEEVLPNCKGVSLNCKGVLPACEAVSSISKGVLPICEGIIHASFAVGRGDERITCG